MKDNTEKSHKKNVQYINHGSDEEMVFTNKI